MSPEVSRDLPQLRIHPQDAAREGLGEGDRALVESRFGKVSVQVHIDDHLRPGVVSLSQGWHQANVAHLTSARRGVDPLTTQPQMTALPVSLTRVA